MGDYDAAIQWLSAHPEGKPSRVAVMTNAGYESVVSADLVEGAMASHHLEEAEGQKLDEAIQANNLAGLVAAHLPLDLTPMADEKGYLDSLRIVVASAADTVVVGLVPLTKRLETFEESKMSAFGRDIAAIAKESGKRVGAVVEAGPLYEPYRQALQKAGLPVFTSMERALRGLRLIAEQ
jgi:acyl-CoA synthetase (NDP forming)